MRQTTLHRLVCTNRLRIATAMFLTKNSADDWKQANAGSCKASKLTRRPGAANNGGGNERRRPELDSWPYFPHIQCRWTQSRKVDPEGDFIRTWVPEIDPSAHKQLHQPPRMICFLDGLPAPLVDLRKPPPRAGLFNTWVNHQTDTSPLSRQALLCRAGQTQPAR